MAWKETDRETYMNTIYSGRIDACVSSTKTETRWDTRMGRPIAKTSWGYVPRLRKGPERYYLWENE